MRTTTRRLQEMKRRGEKIAMMTAYDYTSAQMVESAGIPIILVGDSLGQVVLGYETTVPVTMVEMLHHVRAVIRGSSSAHVVADLPFLSYQADAAEAVRNAGRLLKEGGAQSVKLEGGEHVARTVERIVSAGIPVMGHIGLTPQAVNQLGGYRVQGRTGDAAERLVADAVAIEEAGAYALVLEGVTTSASQTVTSRVGIPTIGIGAGIHCDGQVQVLHDVLGLYTNFVPKHARRYAELASLATEALAEYVSDVQSGAFPTDAESFN